MVYAKKDKIISMIENMHFVVIHNLPLDVYKSIYNLNRYKKNHHMPRTHEYSTYTNITFEKEFVQVVKEVYCKKIKDEISNNPFYSISVDESTDRTMVKILKFILYI